MVSFVIWTPNQFGFFVLPIKCSKMNAKKEEKEVASGSGVADILTADEIAISKVVVSILKGNHNSFDDSSKFGGKILLQWETNTVHSKRWHPGNYIVMAHADFIKLEKLKKIEAGETAAGFFVYVALYVGADAHGADKKGLTTFTSKLRMYTHHFLPEDHMVFDMFLLKERENGNTFMWFYFAIERMRNLYKQIERLVIRTFEMLPKPQMLNRANGELITAELETHPQLEYSFEMVAHIVDIAMDSEYVLSDAEICKRLNGTIETIHIKKIP